MSAERFFIEQPPEPDADEVRLPPDESHHLRNVLRCSVGDEVTLFDGSGVDFVGRIAAFRRGSALIEIERRERSELEPVVAITLAAALVKQAAMDQLVDTCTQLGMSRLVPMTTERTVVKPRPGKPDRWRRIAIKACKQCGRSVVPVFEKAVPFGGVLPTLAGYDVPMLGAAHHIGRVLESRGHANARVSELLRSSVEAFREPGTAAASRPSAIFLIGPEGGFTDEEEQAAMAAGCRPVTLSSSILRAEVAAATAVALVADAAHQLTDGSRTLAECVRSPF
jgi:16S rRNA (uracil1498-N3)-methyltransferase